MATSQTTFSAGSPGVSEDTVNRAAQGAHDAIDRVAERAGPAVERLRAGMSGAADMLHARAEQFGAMQEQWMESTRTCVREHPLATVAVAVGVGMLLSRLLAR